MKIKPDKNSILRWSIVGGPKGARLLRVTIRFPERRRLGRGGKVTYEVGGAPKATARVRYADGSETTESNVEVVWEKPRT